MGHMFVVTPAFAIAVLLTGLFLMRESRSFRLMRWPTAVAGAVAVLLAVGMLGIVFINLYQVVLIRPQTMTEKTREWMTEANGEPPQKLVLIPDGWGRMKGTAVVSGRPVTMTAELVGDVKGLRLKLEQNPVEE
jgi:hypothetical protein